MRTTPVVGDAARGGEAGDVSARERLLREAAELFSRRGYAATSVGEIVAAAGVTKPVLYYHFESKEGLYVALVEETLGRLRPAVEISLRSDGTTAADRIRALCDAIVESASENMSTVRLMRALHYAPPQDAPEIDLWEFPLTIKAALERIVREGARAGEFGAFAPGDLVWAVLGLVNVYIDSNLLQPEIALQPDGLRSSLDLVLAGAAPAHGKHHPDPRVTRGSSRAAGITTGSSLVSLAKTGAEDLKKRLLRHQGGR